MAIAVIGAIGLGLTVLLAIGVWTGRLSMLPFRTTAVVFGLLLLGSLWLVIGLVDVPALEGYPKGIVDGTLIGIVLTSFATAITKLTDDAGESDAVKMTKLFLEAQAKLTSRNGEDS